MKTPQRIKVFLLLFLQKKKNPRFSQGNLRTLFAIETLQEKAEFPPPYPRDTYPVRRS
jgi:hypothetical protein